MSELISLSRLSKILGVGRTTVYVWLNSDQLPKAAKTINGRRYWTRQQIEAFLTQGQPDGRGRR
ncbi:MAG: Helix-turn-helix domain protein [Planctomycetes bacterium ADurb.Bin412]|nr:MAG: Helix-turn-helix domain protein [Planctomycetes bacterium ADurb.Bin412]